MGLSDISCGSKAVGMEHINCVYSNMHQKGVLLWIYALVLDVCPVCLFWAKSSWEYKALPWLSVLSHA